MENQSIEPVQTTQQFQQTPPILPALISEKPKTNFFQIASIIIACLAILGMTYFYLQAKSMSKKLSQNVTATTTPSPSISPTPTPLPITLFTDKYDFGASIAREFNKLPKDYNGEITSNNKSYVWWISPDNLNIINNDEIGLDYSNFSCETDFKDKKEFNAISRNLSLSIKSVMTFFDFTYNQKNSSKSITDDQFYDYVQAYEKGNIKCTLTADADCSTNSDAIPMHYTFSFACTDKYDNNYKEQSPYLKGLNINNAIIHVSDKIGDFAKINVNYRRTGHYTIAKLINNIWTEVYSGQDVPDCETMKKYQVPQEIYGNCFSQNTN